MKAAFSALKIFSCSSLSPVVLSLPKFSPTLKQLCENAFDEYCFEVFYICTIIILLNSFVCCVIYAYTYVVQLFFFIFVSLIFDVSSINSFIYYYKSCWKLDSPGRKKVSSSPAVVQKKKQKKRLMLWTIIISR